MEKNVRKYADPFNPTAEDVARYIQAVCKVIKDEYRALDWYVAMGLPRNSGLLDLVRADAKGCLAQEALDSAEVEKAIAQDSPAEEKTLFSPDVQKIYKWTISEHRRRRYFGHESSLVLIAIDASGSTAGARRSLLKRSAKQLSEGLDKEDKLNWRSYAFDMKVQPLSKEELSAQRIPDLGGNTDYKVVYTFAEAIAADRIVIFTDGESEIKSLPNIPILWVLPQSANPNTEILEYPHMILSEG
jgi:hypothetical protein